MSGYPRPVVIEKSPRDRHMHFRAYDGAKVVAVHDDVKVLKKICPDHTVKN